MKSPIYHYNESMTEQTATYIQLYGADPNSIVDGPGLRYAVFVQGCSHACPGCHNPESHDPCGGQRTAISDILADIRANGLVHDVTISGGEPFDQPEACAALATLCKQDGYGVWVFTGYLYEDLKRKAEGDEATRALLEAADVLVDGPYVEDLRSLDLKWRGSSNQRVIDMDATRKTGQFTLWQAPVTAAAAMSALEKPANW